MIHDFQFYSSILIVKHGYSLENISKNVWIIIICQFNSNHCLPSQKSRKNSANFFMEIWEVIVFYNSSTCPNKTTSSQFLNRCSTTHWKYFSLYYQFNSSVQIMPCLNILPRFCFLISVTTSSRLLLTVPAENSSCNEKYSKQLYSHKFRGRTSNRKQLQ